MDPLKMYFLLEMGIFYCYVSLPEGTPFAQLEQQEMMGSSEMIFHWSSRCLKISYWANYSDQTADWSPQMMVIVRESLQNPQEIQV